MDVPPIKTSEPTFGYSHPLKTAYKKGLLPTVKYGIYGEKLTKKNVSLEHCKPHSQGGKTELGNLFLADKVLNNKRGTEPIWNYLTKENLIRYFSQFVDIKNKYIDGNKYIKEVLKNLGELYEQIL